MFFLVKKRKETKTMVLYKKNKTKSSTHESKDSRCARFGELGLNGEAKASMFEPNLSLSKGVKL